MCHHCREWGHVRRNCPSKAAGLPRCQPNHSPSQPHINMQLQTAESDHQPPAQVMSQHVSQHAAQAHSQIEAASSPAQAQSWPSPILLLEQLGSKSEQPQQKFQRQPTEQLESPTQHQQWQSNWSAGSYEAPPPDPRACGTRWVVLSPGNSNHAQNAGAGSDEGPISLAALRQSSLPHRPGQGAWQRGPPPQVLQDQPSSLVVESLQPLPAPGAAVPGKPVASRPLHQQQSQLVASATESTRGNGESAPLAVLYCHVV